MGSTSGRSRRTVCDGSSWRLLEFGFAHPIAWKQPIYPIHNVYKLRYLSGRRTKEAVLWYKRDLRWSKEKLWNWTVFRSGDHEGAYLIWIYYLQDAETAKQTIGIEIGSMSGSPRLYQMSVGNMWWSLPVLLFLLGKCWYLRQTQDLYQKSRKSETLVHRV